MSFNFFNIMLSRIDLFGKAVEFNFNGGAKSRTRIGGIFSILFFGFWIWAIYDVGLDIFQKRNPSTITTESFTETPAQMTIDPDTFSFAFGVEDPVYESHYINSSIYTIEVTLQHMRRTTNSDGSVSLVWSSTELETEVCSAGHFGDLASNFANLQLDQLYCLKKDQPNIDAVTIQGMYESNAFDYIEISVKQCSNTTSNNTCGTQEELDALLGGGGFFAIYYSNIAINSKNYASPTVRYRDSGFTMFGNNYYKQLYMWLNHLDIKSDSGWLTESEHINEYIKPGSIDETVTLKSDFPSMLDFQIRVSKVSTMYSRSYIKVQDIAAQANGLTSVVLVLMLVFVTPYSNLKFYESLINALFDVKHLKKDPKKSKSVKGKNNDAHISLKENQSQLQTLKKNPNLLEESISQNIVIDSPKHLLKSDRVQSIHEGKMLTSLQKLHLAKSIHKENSNSGRKKSPPQMSFRKLSIESLDSPPTPQEAGQKYVTTAKKHSKKEKSEVDSLGCNGTHMLLDRPTATKLHSKALEDNQNPPKSIDDMLKSIVIDIERPKNPIELDLTLTPTRHKNSFELVEKEDNPTKIKAESPPTPLGDQTPHEISSDLNARSTTLNITFWDYLRSFVRRSDAMKEKMRLLNEGVDRINERLDIFQMFKKFREIDKIKSLLLEYDQLILFEGLPRPQLVLRDGEDENEKDKKKLSRRQLREARFVNDQRKHQMVINSYANVKNKPEATIIDQRLLDIYEDKDE